MSDAREQVIKEIDERGYSVMPAVYSAADVQKAIELLTAWHEKTARQLAAQPFLDTNQTLVYNLQNKDIFFLRLVFASKDIEKILIHYLNDVWYKQIPPEQPNYILRASLGRTSNKALPLHIDSYVPYLGSHVYSIQYSIILEDQDEANGCMVVVPGSHKSGEYAQQSAMKDAVAIKSRAGDVVIWDSRLWHGTTDNTSRRTRWAIISSFVRWWIKQLSNITGSLPREIYDQLSSKEKAILGFCSVPPDDEFKRIDMKTGYADLP